MKENFLSRKSSKQNQVATLHCYGEIQKCWTDEILCNIFYKEDKMLHTTQPPKQNNNYVPFHMRCLG